MKGLGFFGEQVRPEAKLYSHYFRLLREAVFKIAGTNPSTDYCSFAEFIEKEKIGKTSFIWKWFEKDALSQIHNIQFALSNADIKSEYISDILSYEIDMLTDVIEEDDFRIAVDSLTARLESMCFDLSIYFQEQWITIVKDFENEVNIVHDLCRNSLPMDFKVENDEFEIDRSCRSIFFVYRKNIVIC